MRPCGLDGIERLVKRYEEVLDPEREFRSLIETFRDGGIEDRRGDNESRQPPHHRSQPRC